MLFDGYQHGRRLISLFVVFILLVAGMVWWSFSLVPAVNRGSLNTAPTNATAIQSCPTDTYVCADGTVVVRKLPTCAFAACPTPVNAVLQPVVPSTTVNTNTTTNTNQVRPDSRQLIFLPTEAIDAAENLTNTRICINGTYRSSFEYSAYTSTSPDIWVDVEPDQTLLNCTTEATGERTCEGVMTLCGMFRYAAPGQPGLGHVQAYRYALE